MAVGGNERFRAWGVTSDVMLVRAGWQMDSGEDDAEGEDDENDQGGEHTHSVGADEAPGPLKYSVIAEGGEGEIRSRMRRSSEFFRLAYPCNIPIFALSLSSSQDPPRRVRSRTRT